MLTTLLLIVHVLLAMGLVALILFQKSEGGALGIGGGPTGLLTARGATNFLTRGTAILAALFISTSLILALLARADREKAKAADELLAQPSTSAPVVPGPTAPGSATPAQSPPGSGPIPTGPALPALPPLPSVPAAQ